MHLRPHTKVEQVLFSKMIFLYASQLYFFPDPFLLRGWDTLQVQ